MDEEQAFRELVHLVYGEGASELIRKMEPGQSDLHGAAASTHATHQDKRKRQITAGLSAVGATAGAAGLGLGAHNLARGYKEHRTGKNPAGVVTGPKLRRLKAAKGAFRSEKLATALIPLEVAGLGGEVMATRILHADTKKKTVQKDLGELQESSGMPTNRGQLTRMVIPTASKAGVKGAKIGVRGAKKLPEKIVTTKGKLVALKQKADQVSKAEEVNLTWEGEIAKTNIDKQQLFGWASVIEINGEPVVDLQGDRITAEEMEKSAYEFVVKSRKGGDMHQRDGWQPIHKSDMIESFMVTPEKRDAMGLPDTVPTGWWVGFQVRDQQLWDDVKTGKRTGFSIHGRGRREAVG